MPPLGELPLDAYICHNTTCLKLTNLCLAALNALASDMRPKITIGDSAPTAAHKSVQVHVAGRCNRLLLQFAAAGGSSWRGNFQHFEETPSSKYPRMQADIVDLSAKAATCDRYKCGENFKASIRNSSSRHIRLMLEKYQLIHSNREYESNLWDLHSSPRQKQRNSQSRFPFPHIGNTPSPPRIT